MKKITFVNRVMMMVVVPYDKADPYPSTDIPVEAHGQRQCRLIGLKISDFGGGSEELEPENIFIAIRHVFYLQCMHEYLISRDLGREYILNKEGGRYS